jgi:hypothetical protein
MGWNLGNMGLEASSHGKPEMPDELTGPLPRKVEMDSNDAYYLTWVVLLFVVGGAISCGWFLFSSVKQVHQRAALRSDGHEIVGVVTGLPTGRGTEYVKYSFTFKGKNFSGETRIPRHAGIILHERDHILIRFLPSDPTINHPDAWEWSALMDLFPIGFQIFFALLVVAALIFLRRERRLAREGKAVPGVVTSCIRDDRQFKVKYEFRTEEGMLMTGGSSCKDFYETGTCIWILYLPQSPRRNGSYPLRDYSVLG